MKDGSGAESTLERVAREHSPALLRYLRRQTGDLTLADDLLQETLIRIAGSLGGFAGRSSLKTWVHAIARKVVADHMRSPGRRHAIAGLDAVAHLADESPPPDDHVATEAMNRCIREVVDALPDDYRAVLVVHDLESRDCRQTAELLGLSPGAARVRIHRARRRLKAVLSDCCDFHRDERNVLHCDRRA